MTDDLKHLRDQFFEELSSTCEDIEQDLMRLEQNPDDADSYKRLSRDIHTIKGNAGLVGEDELQGLCHALEGALDRLQADRTPAAATELGLQAVDLLREAALNRDDRAVCERIAAFTETLQAAGNGYPQSEQGEASNTTSGPAVTLEEWKTLVQAFAPVEDAVLSLFRESATQRSARKAGTLAVDFAESVGLTYRTLRSSAESLELTLHGIVSVAKSTVPDVTQAFEPLLRALIDRIRNHLSDIFRKNSFSVAVSVKNVSMLAALNEELRSRTDAPVLILRLEIDYETLESDGRTHDSFWSLASMPGHTVAFVLPWSSTVEKAAQFLRQAIGTVPLVSSDEWTTLRQIAHHTTDR